uniref:Uncharacterized protein n=1 Tax=Odontella aurita TaxID=265563 RepID=A0A7S4NHH8_9STRA|mmetsp:Transcript_7548/g.22129  ORF Transcript_7548/g.22129 Transcript_7548/m.22129 type:complete len:531 (+) Transcript_7548:134-1726(+)
MAKQRRLSTCLLAAAAAAAARGTAAFGVVRPSSSGQRSPVVSVPVSVPTVGAGGRASSSSSIVVSRRMSSSEEGNNGDDGGEGGEDPEQFDEVYGAKFFGGAAVKEELFDPKAEDRAAELLRREREEKVRNEDDDFAGSYDRFDDRLCFEDEFASSIGRRVQGSIGAALYDDDDEVDDETEGGAYASNVDWTTPFSREKGSKTPAEELTRAKTFYNRIDAAVVGGKTLDDGASKKKVALRWEISLVWPNLWEARVLLTGTSVVTVDAASNLIVSQTDRLDAGGKDGTDVVGAIQPQLGPRFWDLYHIGMTPSAELSPRLEPRRAERGTFAKYDLFETPPRLTVNPTVLDRGGRDDRIAQAIPNHAFSCIIKTTGPRKQRYVPASPVEIRIDRDEDEDCARVSWSIPVAPEFLAAAGPRGLLPLPGSDDETDDDRDASCGYKLRPSRLVATVKFGGYPQDDEVATKRRELYEEVTKDGHKVKTDDRGRPLFFFVQNDCKACFVSDGGLGMAVYEFRPRWDEANEVGVELEM